MIGNYKEHAVIWDWDGFDDTEEHDFWCNWAIHYGKNVLIPMCALAERGAYMAEKGFNVTAFDIIDEMVSEGNKRFGGIKNLKLLHGDIRNFSFSIEPVDYVFIKGDINHLLNIIDIKNAFQSINKHMRKGGCIVIELELPTKKSYSWSKEIYHPRKIKHTDKKIWKTGEGNYDPQTKRKYIFQTVFIEDNEGTKSFEHKFYLQLYDREEIIDSLIESNFLIKNEFCDHKYTKYDGGEYLIVEGIKV
jgi:ubiquinone/menaquinone biosynthesis C-methylase UbiE